MRIFSILVFSLVLAAGWENDFEEAKKHAEKEHKLILLNFSGSDWCVPCIQFRKLVLDAAPFTTFATENLVLVNADFPRLSKNQLSNELQK
jgi:thiol:disulfide interchange protein